MSNNYFKSQQEIWKYLVDCDTPLLSDWSPYIEPKPKTKVWRWELVTESSSGAPTIFQTYQLYTEEDAARFKSGYTKVPGSEREI